jgi:hypothetical protein
LPRRNDPDDEPEEWKTALPMRSPVPLLLILIAAQAVVAALLVVVGLTGSVASRPTSPYYQSR